MSIFLLTKIFRAILALLPPLPHERKKISWAPMEAGNALLVCALSAIGIHFTEESFVLCNIQDLMQSSLN